MIIAKLNDVLNSMPVLKDLSKRQMPALTAFKLMKIIKSVDAHFEDFKATKMDLIGHYGMRDDNNELIFDQDENIIFSEENKKIYLQELKDILDEEVDIIAQYITLEDLGNLNLTPVELLRLDCFIEQKE